MNIFYYLEQVAEQLEGSQNESPKKGGSGGLENKLLYVLKYQRSLVIDGLH